LRIDPNLVPYSAGGTPINLTTSSTGSPNNVVFVGFGQHGSGVISESNIDSDKCPNADIFAISTHEHKTLNVLSATFTPKVTPDLIVDSLIVTAQLWISTTGDNIFTPIPEAIVSDHVKEDRIVYGTVSGLSIPVTPKMKLLLVFSASNKNNVSISGYASGGVKFS